MKKIIRFLMALLAGLFLPLLAFCQEIAADIADAIAFEPATWFASLAALATAVIVITQWLKARISTTGLLTKLLSWLVAVVLAFIGWWLQLGLFAGIEWYWVLAYALASGLVANSVFDLNVVTAIMNLFKNKSNG